MSELIIALITSFGTVASVSGVVIYVFNGTRKLIREIHATIQEMHATMQDMHKEAEKRHREVIELLKKGFGDMSRDIGEIKELVKQ